MNVTILHASTVDGHTATIATSEILMAGVVRGRHGVNGVILFTIYY